MQAHFKTHKTTYITILTTIMSLCIALVSFIQSQCFTSNVLESVSRYNMTIVLQTFSCQDLLTLNKVMTCLITTITLLLVFIDHQNVYEKIKLKESNASLLDENEHLKAFSTSAGRTPSEPTSTTPRSEYPEAVVVVS